MGMSLDELAEKINYSKGYLSEVETGKKPGSLRLAKALIKVSDGEITLADFRT